MLYTKAFPLTNVLAQELFRPEIEQEISSESRWANYHFGAVCSANVWGREAFMTLNTLMPKNIAL